MNIPPELLAQAVRHRVLSGRQALYLARMQPPRKQGQALIALAQHLSPEERPAVSAEALAAASAIGDERSRAEALAGLAPHLPPTERPIVLERIIEDCAGLGRSDSLQLIAQLGPFLSEVGGEELMREVVRAMRDVSRWWP